jgi:hypothetical protein
MYGEREASVLYAELICQITDAMYGRDDVEHALATTLETLGFLLPERLVRALSATLPTECSDPLALGLSASRLQLRTHGAAGAEPYALPRRAMERIQMVCAALAPMLPPDLAADLLRELPEGFKVAFENDAIQPMPTRVRRDTLASGRPGASRPLSEATPGSTHPLHSAHPDRAQQDSVLAPNPHADTKLSSARGTTQR